MKKVILLLTFILSAAEGQNTLSQWYQQSVPVSKPITGIKFIDSLKGWACTQWGTAMDSSYIFHTSNGGTNWVIQFRYPGAFFEAMAIVDANTGYVGGYAPLPGPGALIFKTTNGGLNWFNSGAPSGPTDMFFINRDTGWYCNNAFGGDIRRTTDGGTTWQLMGSGVTASVYRVFFLNYTTGWCGANGYLYKTINAGQSWFLLYDNIQQIYSIFFINNNTGWIGIFNKQVKFTTDGGSTWVSQVLPPMAGTSVFDLQRSGTKLFAGQGYEFIFVTTNNGLNWGYQTDSSNSRRISFADSLKGWTGDYGISHTTNSGGPITYLGIININNWTPASYSLSQNYPNPFNSQTQIRFSLTRPSFVKLKVYDILGREKTIWESNSLLGAGIHQLEFNAENFSSGVYFYQLTVLNEQLSVVYRETRKMILIK